MSRGLGDVYKRQVEIRDLVNGIAADDRMFPDFEEGYKVSRVLEAIAKSAEEKRWMAVNEI